LLSALDEDVAPGIVKVSVAPLTGCPLHLTVALILRYRAPPLESCSTVNGDTLMSLTAQSVLLTSTVTVGVADPPAEPPPEPPPGQPAQTRTAAPVTNADAVRVVSRRVLVEGMPQN
jgi:hypothetical protein